MDVAETERAPFLSAIEAQLFVADVAASCAFYSEKLGFEIAFVYGDPPFYGQVTRDRARVNLRAVDEPVFAGNVRTRLELLSASITVESVSDLEQLFARFQTAGVRFHQSLQTEPWGARGFVVADPDGNLILFAGPAR